MRPPITGRVGENVSARYLAELKNATLSGHRWSALLERVTVERPGHPPVERFTLLDLDSAADGWGC